jgi:flavin reductase (DIM6/NTAB) family NADH-FMN oxidoreductase RutF
VVRPQRYTRLFMEQYDTFTLSVLPEAYRSALNLLGSRSGRDGNKIAEAGLTPAASRIAASPTFAEAELVIECKKLYWADLDPTHFINPALDQNYPRKDYHRQYFGEVLAIYGTRNYMDQG